MASPTLYTIDRPGPGRLSTMARPRGGDWLADELAALHELGVCVLVSALTPQDRDDLDLTDEPSAARAAGLVFVDLPIPDFAVPDIPAVLPQLCDLYERLRGGAHLVIHCRAGIGRSSLLAAGLLVLDGVHPDETWRLISAARGCTVPETDEQRAWPGRLAGQLAR